MKQFCLGLKVQIISGLGFFNGACRFVDSKNKINAENEFFIFRCRKDSQFIFHRAVPILPNRITTASFQGTQRVFFYFVLAN